MEALLGSWLPTIFALANLAVMPFWILMIVAPTWRVTCWVMESVWSIAWVPIAYLCMLTPELPRLLGLFLSTSGPPTLGVVRELLGTDYGTTVAWLHLLAFDLFVGRWIFMDSRSRRTNVWMVGPILLTTLLFGPLGLILWLAVRAGAGQRA